MRLMYKFITMHRTELKLQLTPRQRQLFLLLNTYRTELKLKTVLRVAGGWVRDKILGRQSHDIDITLDDMKGQEFVLLLQEHSQSRPQKITGFGVTKLNPLMSKHLETATAKILGYSIDFVNLRSQTYGQESRIPMIQQGTPYLDAVRRDFTVNALFYNLETEQVEDYTQRGISDLKNRIIRTPLQPLITFRDDPLRVLRCFRFKAKLEGFSIDSLIYETLAHDQQNTIHSSLQNKVSKERRGIQMAGILKANQPIQSLAEVLKYGFWNLIFEVPKESKLDVKDVEQTSFRCLCQGIKSIHQEKLENIQEIIEKQQINQQQMRLFIRLSLLMLPYHSGTIRINKINFNLIEHITKNQLKYPAKTSKFVTKVSELRQALQLLVNKKYTEQQLLPKIVRWLLSAQEKWELVLHALNAYMRVLDIHGFETNPLYIRHVIHKYQVADCYSKPCFLNGSMLVKRGKKGPIMKVILDNARIFQALNKARSEEYLLDHYITNELFFEDPLTYN